MTFAICLFLVLMQFLWKYVEDMVGKGLETKVLAEMFLYAALYLVPMALPLAVLLASLMVFGNMGERLELLAVKSAGIPLLRTMKPLIILVSFISIGAFFYQNHALPKVQTKFFSLLISIRQASPEIDIPEGVFYKEIDGYNLYVEHKDRKTGMLYDVLIYDIAEGFNNMAVIICDSAKMSMTEDKTMLIMKMYSGQQFRNFKQGSFSSTAASVDFVPYARENFREKTMMISYDANFNRIGEETIEGSSTSNYVSKDLSALTTSIDSMGTVMDSVNIVDRKMMKRHSYFTFRNSYSDREQDSLIGKPRPAGVVTPDPDSLLASKELFEQSSIMQNAVMKAENNNNEFLFRSMNKTTVRNIIIRHWIEWHRKFTVPFTCLIFFFIGAPLGSIVRKGGLGTPIVISVMLFIVYYILDNVGYKMTRDGVWVHWFGMWFSSFILTPIGVFLTHKAMNDSVILNPDTYFNILKRLFFIREKRKYPVKSVVIDKPQYPQIVDQLSELSGSIASFCNRYNRFNYRSYWLKSEYETELRKIRMLLESILYQLSNSRNLEVLAKAEEFPVLFTPLRLFNPGSLPSKICFYFLPVGILIRLISFLVEKSILKDLIKVDRLCGEMKRIIGEAHETKQPAITASA